MPAGLSAAQTMQLGTAGFTAALAIHRMEQNDQAPDLGPVVVTGATGGVGSIAVDMLAGRGYEVAAVTGKASEEDYLRKIGASRILLRGDIDFGKRPLEMLARAGAFDELDRNRRRVFDSLEALITQMDADSARARAILAAL